MRLDTDTYDHRSIALLQAPAVQKAVVDNVEAKES